MISREVVESPLKQGADEQVVYSLNTEPWGGTPADTTVTVYDVTTGGAEDVSEDVLTGDVSESGDTITLPAIGGLTAKHIYRVEVRFASGGNVLETYFMIEAER
jgi:hypothetical protein